jgi:branched-chain amino acid transport system ATP-binding protein
MLKLERVSLNYGSFRALSDISLQARDGELVVLLGAYGAGKCSIFRSASGLDAATGHIRFCKHELIGMRPSQIVQAGVVQCPEGRKLFPGMSVLRNLVLGAYVHRTDSAGNRRRLEDIFGLFPILDQKKDDPAGSLSGGQQQMVAIGRAMMGRPRALLLDEPSLGLAPLVVRQMFEVIQQINRAGTTVLLAEQNAFAALKGAHRAYVLELGRVAMEGDSDALLRNPDIRRAYIGA